MYQKRNFQHNGIEYEIRIASDGLAIYVRAFLNGRPANGYKYSVEVLTHIDAQMSNALIDPVEELVKTATSDVKNGIWEKYLTAVATTSNQNS